MNGRWTIRTLTGLLGVALWGAGCGGSLDIPGASTSLAAPAASPASPPPALRAYSLGTLQGTLASGLAAASQPYDGHSADRALVLNGSDVALHASALTSAFQNDHPIVLLSTDAAQVNQLLGVLGEPQDYTPQPGQPAPEVYAVDHESNGDFYVFEGFPPADADSAQQQQERAEGCLTWLAEDGHRPQAAQANNDLRSLASAHVVTEQYAAAGGIFQFIFRIYSCHSFSLADGVGCDWFYVEQSVMTNMGSAYQGKKDHYEGNQDMFRYYLGDLHSDNYLDGTTAQEVSLLRHGPESATEVIKVTSGVAFNFGGQVGYKSGKPAGTVSVGVAINNSQTVEVKDCKIINNSSTRGNNAEWKYEFKRCELIKYLLYAGLTEPPVLATKNFQPVNQWIWKLAPTVRDLPNGKTLISKIRVDVLESQGGKVYGPYIIEGPEHLAMTSRWESRIALRYPPLLVPPDDLTFRAAANSVPVDLSVSRDWTIASDQPWCTVTPDRGSGQNPRTNVTVDSNGTGADRRATLTCRTADGAAEATIAVFQSRF